jgi:VWFA-related protein
MKIIRPSHKLATLLTVVTLLAVSGLAFSQSPATPPPAVQAPNGSPDLRFAVRLIQVTVVAEDGDGKPVTDLKKEDFTLRDQGQQQIVSFFAQQNTPASAQFTSTASIGGPANYFSNHVESSPAGANSVTILLFDALNTGFRDLSYAKERVIAFLQHMQPQDQVALYVLTPSRLYVMHDFTNDSATLVRLMGGKPNKTSGTTAASASGSSADEVKIEKIMSDSLAESNSFYKGMAKSRVETTSDAMLHIASNVVNIPGRKNLVWISGGFPVFMGPAIPIGSREDSQDFTATLSSTAKQLGDANVAVYPVDARGLVAPRGGRRGSPSTNKDAMVLIANGTGGRPLYNTNDIASSIRKAVDDSRVSYVLGYYPTNNQWDGHFREINVKVARPGLHLRYRTGYYAIPANPDNANRNELLVADAIRSPLQMIDLGLEVRTEPVPSSNGRELKVGVRVDPSQMHFIKDGDHWTDDIEVVWVGLSADGRVLDRNKDTIELHPEGPGYADILQKGLSFTEHIRTGSESVELRLIVRDHGTGAIGSVNIPLSRALASAGAQSSSR